MQILLRKLPTLLLALLAPLLGYAADAPKATTPPETPTSFPGFESPVYRNLSPVPIRLHVTKPVGWKATDRRPALIYFYGGGWTHGTPAQSVGWAKWAAQHGLVGVAPDYRVKERFGTSPLEAVADGRLALHWVEGHSAELGIDPTKIAVAGSSAGGHLALWAALSRTPPGSDPADAPAIPPAAVILLSAVSDTTVEKGYTPGRFGANAKALSPIDQLDPKMPPMLVFHGDADKTVPQTQTLALRDKLIATGNQCQFVNVPGGAHSFTGQDGWNVRSKALIATFLKQQNLLPISLPADAEVSGP